jgi:hypothetical protein
MNEHAKEIGSPFTFWKRLVVREYRADLIALGFSLVALGMLPVSHPETTRSPSQALCICLISKHANKAHS